MKRIISSFITLSFISTALGCLLSSYSCAMDTDSKSALYDFELFKVVQKLHDIIDELRLESEEHGVSIDSGKKGWPGSNPFYNQTKKGLFLLDRSELWTPWGKVMLTGGGAGSFWGFLAFRQLFFKRLKTSFCRVTESLLDRGRVKFYELKSNDIDLREMRPRRIDPDFRIAMDNLNSEIESTFTEIPRSELESRRGQDIFIRSNSCWTPIYKVHGVDGYRLPEPELLDYRDYRGYKEVKAAWEAMEEKFSYLVDAEEEERIGFIQSFCLRQKKTLVMMEDASKIVIPACLLPAL